jgi:2-alkyl-3-oxoalkanoate reductase
MRLFVTGANGFVGRAVVAAALERGHRVHALVRKGSTVAADGPLGADGVELVRGDIRYLDGWEQAMGACDVVVHLAASFGDFDDQWLTNVVATERLLDRLVVAGPKRLVHISTFSVYDYAALASGATLDESSPLEAEPTNRDAYAQTKLEQERIVRDAAADGALDLTVIRPGAVYGPGNLWDGGRAMTFGGRGGLVIGPNAPLKLIYVAHCAEAIVLAAETDRAIGATINLVDDDLPTPRAFAAAIRRAGGAAPPALPLPYGVAVAAASSAAWLDRRFLDSRGKYPELLVPRRLAARYKALNYSNRVAKDLLGWHPRYTLDEALRRSLA